MALQVLDRAMQSFGAEGISQDQPLAKLWSGIRTLRYADVGVHPVWGVDYIVDKLDFQGPDEVHLQQIGKQELKRLPLVEARTANVSKRSKALLASAARESKL